MRRFVITTAIFAGLSAAAIAAPDYDGQVFRGDGVWPSPEHPQAVETSVQDTIDSAKREANEIAATARENGIPFGPVRHELEHRVHFQSAEIVSVLREDWAYENGATVSLWLVPVNWDARADALIPIQSVLGDPSGSRAAYERVAALLQDATVEQVWDGDPQGWAEAIEAAIRPDPMYLSTFTFVPSTVPDRIGGIAWHFEPHLVAPGAEGAISVVIPQEALRDLVAPEWRGLFAGEPAPILDAPYISAEDELLREVVARY